MQKLLLILLVLAGCASTPPSPIGQPVLRAPPSAVDAEDQTWLKDAPPGALNDNVQQNNIATTICVPGWTATVRPPTSYTNGLKRKLLRERGLPTDEARSMNSTTSFHSHLVAVRAASTTSGYSPGTGSGAHESRTTWSASCRFWCVEARSP